MEILRCSDTNQADMIKDKRLTGFVRRECFAQVIVFDDQREQTALDREREGRDDGFRVRGHQMRLDLAGRCICRSCLRSWLRRS